MSIEYVETLWIITIITVSSMILLPIFSWVITHRDWGQDKTV